MTEAHGYVAIPKPTWNSGTADSSWVKEFTSPWGGSKWTAAQYKTTAASKGFKDLRSFLESYGPVCGNTNPSGTAQAIPSDKKVHYSRAIVHPGPCEIWLDNTRVYSNDDCEAAFGSSIPVFSIDWSSCASKCVLRFYWLGLQDQGARWQSYKNCVPVSGSGGSSTSTSAATSTATKESSSSSTKTTKTPKSTTKAPTKTKARSIDEENEVEGVPGNSTLDFNYLD
ncbi:hypothetical protein Gpo141_00013687 [Globisporangium polare]